MFHLAVTTGYALTEFGAYGAHDPQGHDLNGLFTIHR